MAKRITKNTTVYTASAWWRDNDPSMQVVARNAKVAKEKIAALMEEAAEASSGYDSISDALDDIAWSGVHAFALKDLASSRELDEAIDELESAGYWYPPTP